VLPPRAKHTVLGKVQGGSFKNSSCLLGVEPAHVPIEGLCLARVFTRASVEIHEHQPDGKSALSTSCEPLNTHAPRFSREHRASTQLHSSPEFRCPRDSITLMIASFSEEKLTLPKGTVLGVAQEVSKNSTVTVDDEEETNKGTDRTFFRGNKEVPRWLRKYLDEKLAHLSSAERKIIEPVLIKCADIFHDEVSNDFKSTSVIVHKVETGDAPP